eukprot:m.303546 g.303546  ORF g.303546 m.303546 type:complete len:123 (+) comp19591_c0_seq22:109-477(+)
MLATPTASATACCGLNNVGPGRDDDEQLGAQPMAFAGQSLEPCRCRVQLDVASATPQLAFSCDQLEVRNDSWTFESVRANHPVPPRAVSFFEVQIKTAGIIQVLLWRQSHCIPCRLSFCDVI